MTRKEAIFILANIDRRVCDDELSEALDMAIKALEQEPCEDAVSREEAFEGLNSLNGTAELDMAFEVIEKLPSVTPIHIDRTVQDFVDKCRECGREKVLDKIRAEIDGAKMPKNRMAFFRDGIDCALQIIDKYKAEREDKE